MAEDTEKPSIKITDRRHFDQSGEKRADAEVSPEPPAAPAPAPTAKPPAGPSSGSGPAEARPGPERSDPQGAGNRSPRPDPGADPGNPGGVGDLLDIASRLSSSFSLLVARLAQETEIYLGLVPFPGKETAEPDLEAARAMIDMLSMLQEKTRGNLDAEESRLLENLLYTYRLEFVRRRSGGGVQ